MLGPSAPFGDPPEVLVRGFAFFQALVSACQLGLFEYLSASPHRTKEEIATRLKLPSHSVNVLLLTCTSLGLLKVNPNKNTYSNAWMTNKKFVSSSPGNHLATIEAFHSIMYQPFFHLTDSLRKGTNMGLSSLPGPGETLY